MEKKYSVISQLGEKGREARVFLVEDKFQCTYAAKQFRKNKAENAIINEINLQRKCSKYELSPKIVDYNLKDKYIVMEKMGCHLTDMIVAAGGRLSEFHQKSIVKMMKTLDKICVFQSDPNLLNYMVKNGKIYMIDFGAVRGPEAFIQTRTPNMSTGLLAFVLKMKDVGFPPATYAYMLSRLPQDKQQLIK
jgi:tRNA A-37 threonylcarbamoyl transferase component Bud32